MDLCTVVMVALAVSTSPGLGVGVAFEQDHLLETLRATVAKVLDWTIQEPQNVLASQDLIWSLQSK